VTNEELVAEVSRMRALLREIEWLSPGGDGVGFCVRCEGSRPIVDSFGVTVGGHRSGCPIDIEVRKGNL
jgi:hypothetical protein